MGIVGCSWHRFSTCGAAPLGAAHAPSPDARCGHPALRSLDASAASPSWLRVGSNAGSRGTGSPELPWGRGTVFVAVLERAAQRGTVLSGTWVQVFNLHRKRRRVPQVENLRPLGKPAATWSPAATRAQPARARAFAEPRKWVQVFNLHRKRRRIPQVENLRPLGKPAATWSTAATWALSGTGHGGQCPLKPAFRLVLPGEDRRSDPGLSRALATEGSAR
jgi:hypothetical protein